MNIDDTATQGLCSSWNIGFIPHYSNIPLLHHSVLPVLIPIISLFQQSIIPIFQEITRRDNGVLAREISFA
jgi:hypothetical protein